MCQGSFEVLNFLHLDKMANSPMVILASGSMVYLQTGLKEFVFVFISALAAAPNSITAFLSLGTEPMMDRTTGW